jgi:hypothetical protein
MERDEVLKIVDECFHSYASFYRQDAKELAEELIDELESNKGQTLPINSVNKRYVVSAIKLADYESVAISDTITGYVLCHFNNNDTFENRKAIAETVVNKLNGC